MPGAEEEFDVLCYGAISMDNITRLPYLPHPRREISAISEYDALGGEALSVAIPLATWGMRVLVVGNFIGTDWKGQFIMDGLAHYPNVDTRYLRQHENVRTPFSRLWVTPEGERIRISYWFGDSPQVELTPEMMQQARLLSVDAYGRNERDRAAMVARNLGRTVITNDAIWPQYPLASLSDVDIISRAWLQSNFPGAYEYDHVLELQAQGAGVMMVTDSDRPVLVVRSDGSAFGVEPYHVPNIIDTSGAGNLFRAGIIYAWNRAEWPLEQKVDFACAAAALSCQRENSTSRPPTLAEIEALMCTRQE